MPAPINPHTRRDATKLVGTVHTTIARCAVTMLATDARITPGGAVTALFEHGIPNLKAQRPDAMAAYWTALSVLGIGRGDMDYARFMAFVDAPVRLQLRGDRKVAGHRR